MMICPRSQLRFPAGMYGTKPPFGLEQCCFQSLLRHEKRTEKIRHTLTHTARGENRRKKKKKKTTLDANLFFFSLLWKQRGRKKERKKEREGRTCLLVYLPKRRQIQVVEVVSGEGGLYMVREQREGRKERASTKINIRFACVPRQLALPLFSVVSALKIDIQRIERRAENAIFLNWMKNEVCSGRAGISLLRGDLIFPAVATVL